MANPYDAAVPNGQTFTPWEPEPSLIDKALNVVHRITGKRDPEELQEEARERQDRRQRETPSAIYAHKSIEVSNSLSAKCLDLLLPGNH